MPVISKPIDSACGSDNIRARIPCSSEHSEQSPTVKRGSKRGASSHNPLWVWVVSGGATVGVWGVGCGC